MGAIEVRELIVKASVSGGSQAGGQSGAANPVGQENNSVSPNDEMINTCIEKILEILREKNER
jgi:hypothetical protein